MWPFSWIFGKKEQTAKVEPIDEELLRKIREIKEYVERRPESFDKMRKALMKCQVLFSQGIRDSKIKDKDLINASIQATNKSIKDAEEKVNKLKKASGKSAEKR
jgi:hypothetical protein